MNKFTAACMDSWLHVFDARTQHPTLGFAKLSKQVRHPPCAICPGKCCTCLSSFLSRGTLVMQCPRCVMIIHAPAAPPPALRAPPALQLPLEATLWAAAHLPQDREACMVAGGDGSLGLYRYSYPDQRQAAQLSGRRATSP